MRFLSPKPPRARLKPCTQTTLFSLETGVCSGHVPWLQSRAMTVWKVLAETGYKLLICSGGSGGQKPSPEPDSHRRSHASHKYRRTQSTTHVVYTRFHSVRGCGSGYRAAWAPAPLPSPSLSLLTAVQNLPLLSAEPPMR